MQPRRGAGEFALCLGERLRQALAFVRARVDRCAFRVALAPGRDAERPHAPLASAASASARSRPARSASGCRSRASMSSRLAVRGDPIARGGRVVARLPQRRQRRRRRHDGGPGLIRRPAPRPARPPARAGNRARARRACSGLPAARPRTRSIASRCASIACAGRAPGAHRGRALPGATGPAGVARSSTCWRSNAICC